MTFSVFNAEKILCILYGQVFVTKFLESYLTPVTISSAFFVNFSNIISMSLTVCLYMMVDVMHPVVIQFIRKTCPCNEYPLKPHFYIEKLGFAGVYLFFLFLLQNIDCGYSLEPPRF